MTRIGATQIQCAEHKGAVVIDLIDEVSGVSMRLAVNPDGASHVMRALHAATARAIQNQPETQGSAA